MDGMESDLVKDFDANLSGLGLELGANAYNMSEVLNLPIFKQEGLLAANQGLPPLQYMLCASTSPATKVYDETLTYLNQGQSYEIKLKKLRDIPEIGTLKIVKSQIRVVFHDRRLQYTEHEQFQSWKFNRPGDRLLNIDIPMSVGAIQPKEHSDHLNLVEFMWDVDKEASVWVQVRCISTEFTARKHGGEKGVPFRIQVDTYEIDGSGELGRHIHSASCQIKVFKPKGADRKLKTDKDKMEKRSAQEKLKYQPSYDSTLLSEGMPTITPTETVEDLSRSNQSRIIDQITDMVSEYSVIQHNNNGTPAHVDQRHRNSGSFNNPSVDNAVPVAPPVLMNTSQRNHGDVNLSPLPNTSFRPDVLIASSTIIQTQEWLQRNRFGGYLKTFGNFCGSDLLTLSRDDITQICGPADGIRLYNALRSKTVRPRLTLYLTPAAQGNDNNICIYKAFYLQRATVSELVKATSYCLFEDCDTTNPPRICQILYQPRRSSIHVLVTDEVVSLMKDESSFTVSLIKNENSDRYQVILKP
ncbi:unnamed protein product [Clavelina lepadiformis]|uniref:Grh/CP2 DB domain-containing protein n=1 Tax=Clavelina lepadiformis TaxID=159417 RepID=A0ABP0GX33_CLALP